MSSRIEHALPSRINFIAPQEPRRKREDRACRSPVSLLGTHV
jgi:hypothetical protein